ncbi:ArgP/LysG family DNA-binding transcriptional regulator [Jannaschia aquimarina]|uniref:Putative HTH-type transcriptional regulator n=1 Tax=Jannaschia aquimarina TaxID=935700 RepID=A0A0D1EGM9_9RHOB|nr:ArgP/LysG family DNA-binding transcriptional regulator [Jannaschia aquimarina]KIT16071.1 putative HTH-type transcriptional regulator [Jannaschia aquimarina]SNT01634.1 transcriptional regulator, LysR family [Jannaschia aquimarina]
MFAPTLLATLDAVCETGSFDLAAARVGVTPSAVSQRMKALAEAAGGALFVRLGPAEPTALGRRLLRHAREMAALDAALAADLGQEGAPPALAIAINADSLETWAVPALAAVEGLRFDVVIDDQDHSADLLRRGEVSAAVTAQTRPLPGCDAYPLGALRYLAACSPGFRDRWFPDGPDAAALARAPTLRFNPKDALQTRWIRQVTGEAINPPAHSLPATSPLQAALRAGLAWGVNPEGLMRPDLEAGHLVELIPGATLETPLTWQVSRVMADVLAPLTRAMRRAARDGM